MPPGMDVNVERFMSESEKALTPHANSFVEVDFTVNSIVTFAI